MGRILEGTYVPLLKSPSPFEILQNVFKAFVYELNVTLIDANLTPDETANLGIDSAKINQSIGVVKPAPCPSDYTQLIERV